MTKISPPSWYPNATLTKNGWTRGDEIIIPGRFTQEQVDDYMNPKSATPKKAPTKKPKKAAVKEQVVLTEAPVGNKSIDNMSDVERAALSETSSQNVKTTLTE